MNTTVWDFYCSKEDFIHEYDKFIARLEEEYHDQYESVYFVKTESSLIQVHCSVIIKWKPNGE